MLSKVFSSLGDSVMIVTLQSPGEARGHCDTAGPRGTERTMVTLCMTWHHRAKGHCDTVGLHGSKESIVTLWVLVEPQRPL